MIEDAFQYALAAVPIPSGRILWLYGLPGIASGDVYHPWQGYAASLPKVNAAFSDVETIKGEYDAVIVNCPRQQEESEGLLALAFKLSKGFVMAGAQNDAGGGRLKRMMESYGLEPQVLSKAKSRIVWAASASKAKKEVIEENLAHLSFRKLILGGKDWWTVPGLFGWDKMDAGSELLLEALPADIKGRIADFGCGYGYLGVMLRARYSAIDAIDAYDVDARAVKACGLNAGASVVTHWQDIRTLNAHSKYDVIVMNPPFHSAGKENMALGQAFIEKAWESLKLNGRLFLVANQHLPYEKVVPGLTLLQTSAGYKIITGRKS